MHTICCQASAISVEQRNEPITCPESVWWCQPRQHAGKPSDGLKAFGLKAHHASHAPMAATRALVLPSALSSRCGGADTRVPPAGAPNLTVQCTIMQVPWYVCGPHDARARSRPEHLSVHRLRPCATAPEPYPPSSSQRLEVPHARKGRHLITSTRHRSPSTCTGLAAPSETTRSLPAPATTSRSPQERCRTCPCSSSRA